MANRKFDISWISQTPKKRALKKNAQLVDMESQREHARTDALLLSAFRLHPKKPLRVTELAKEARVDFDDGLKGVLRLVSRGFLDIQERDRVAGDHLVELTREGATEPSRGSAR